MRNSCYYKSVLERQHRKFIRTEMRKWRNWQTRRLQVPVVAHRAGSEVPPSALFFVLQDLFLAALGYKEKKLAVITRAGFIGTVGVL